MVDKERGAGNLVTCPECKGRGMFRPEGEWTNETCPTCNGRGKVAKDLLADQRHKALDAERR